MKKHYLISVLICAMFFAGCGMNNEVQTQNVDSSEETKTDSTYTDSSNASATSNDDAENDKVTDNSNSTDSDSSIDISYELKKITESYDNTDENAIYVTYPEFSVNTPGYEKLEDKINNINSEIQNIANDSLSDLKDIYKIDSEDSLSPSPSEYHSEAYSINILKSTSKIVSISIAFEQDNGDRHPNIYFYYYNINPQTGENFSINDVINLSSDLADYIAENLITDYPELTLPDKATLSQDVYDALNQNNVEWNISDDGEGILINFLNSGILESTFNVPDLLVEIKYNDNPDYFKMTF